MFDWTKEIRRKVECQTVEDHRREQVRLSAERAKLLSRQKHIEDQLVANAKEMNDHREAIISLEIQDVT